MPATSITVNKVQSLLGALLVICVMLNFANVVARYAFNTALLGIEELQVYLLVGISFIGAALVSWRRDHLRMAALVGYMRPAAKRAARVLEELTMTGLLAFTAVQSGRYTWQMVLISRKSDLMEIPMWIPHGCVTLGLTLMALIAAYRLAVERGGPPAHASGTSAPAGEATL